MAKEGILTHIWQNEQHVCDAMFVSISTGGWSIDYIVELFMQTFKIFTECINENTGFGGDNGRFG